LDRIRRLKAALKKKRIGSLLITELSNVRYLTGFTGSSAMVFLSARGDFFYTDYRYKEQSLLEVSGCQVVITGGRHVEFVKRHVKSLGVKSLAFEDTARYATFEDFIKDFTLKPARGMVEELRAVKDARELQLIALAEERARLAFADIKGYIKQGVTERSIALRLEAAIKKRGAEKLPFEIIVASGARSALPHAKPTDKKLAAGDLVIIDWGAEADGYFSDMTRTFLLKESGKNNIKNNIKDNIKDKGRVNNGADNGADGNAHLNAHIDVKNNTGDEAKKREIYALTLLANETAIASVRVGVRALDVDRAARSVIQAGGYGECFGHGTGHGVGLDVHEPPTVSPTSGKTVISAGAVFTIEPGIYVPGLGGVRIEDMVVAESRGARLITGLSKNLEML
jgi:Xaa-Pro aminopeptidase